MADDDDGNRLEEVDSNMVELNLFGMSSIGPVQMRLSAASASVGRMEEIRNDKKGLLEVPPFGEGFVDSFFDLNFDLRLSIQYLHGEGPMRCTARLSRKPPAPGDVYENQTQIRLLDFLGQFSGVRIGPGRFRLNPIVEVDVFENAICWLDLHIPDGSTLKIPLFGRSTENVFFEGDVEGSAFDDDGDLLDEVKTEMVELNLRGYHSALGHVNMRLNNDLPSTGQMEERTDHNTGILDVPPFFKAGTVNSFFDIYFELEMLGQVMHGNGPLHWSGVLSHKPAGPMDIYESLEDIQLLDEDGNPTIFFISATQYRPNPVVEVDFMDTSIGSVDILTLSGPSYTVELQGTSTMKVFFEGDFEGSAYDDDRDSHDEVHIEMVALQLTGSDPEIGPVILRSDPCALSIGLIEERTDIKTGRLDIPPFSGPDYDFPADSFFDITFEIEFAGTVLHGERPMHLGGVLNHKPAAPGDIYENLEDIRLVDANGVDTDYFLSTAFYEPTACGDAAHPYPLGDANRDCRVNLLDVAIVGLHWLECTRPECN
jgi:hypothetical protein